MGVRRGDHRRRRLTKTGHSLRQCPCTRLPLEHAPAESGNFPLPSGLRHQPLRAYTEKRETARGSGRRSFMLIAEHLVASTRGLAPPLHDEQLGTWLWQHLRKAFPDALSLVIMPEHLHLVGLPGGHARFRRVLSGCTAATHVRFDVLPPQPAMSREIARRMIRYGLHNPVNAGLVRDPYEWRWSTLRDLVGAAHPVWTRAAYVAKVLGVSRRRLPQLLTHTADQQPAIPQLTPVATYSLPELRVAVAAVMRVPLDRTLSSPQCRHLVVRTCAELGVPARSQLQAELGITARTLRRLLAKPHPAVPAVRLCLGDERLRRGLMGDVRSHAVSGGSRRGSERA